MPTETKPPRSAAARAAAREGEHPAEAAERQTPEERNDQPDLAAQLAQAVAAREQAEAAREQAEQEAEIAREEAEIARQQASTVQAVAEIPVAAAEEPVPAREQAPRNVVPRGENNEELTPDEISLVKRLRDERAREIRRELDRAPQRIGIDLDQYTLVHLRGCPNPDRTETYEAKNTGTGQMFTVHRCVECGAHLPIPH